MVKYLLVVLISVFILTGCHGCSFIKEKFGKKEGIDQTQSDKEKKPKKPRRTAEPIPIDPQHS